MSRAGRAALALAALLAALPGAAAARARPRAPADSDRTLARMAARDRVAIWAAGAPRPVPGLLLVPVPGSPSLLPPATRERVAAPPFTGWGYGGTVPGAWPGF